MSLASIKQTGSHGRRFLIYRFTDHAPSRLVITLMLTAVASPFGAYARTSYNMAECLHVADPDERAEACTELLGNTRDRNVQIRLLNARGLALCSSTGRCSEAVPDFTEVVRLAPGIAGYWDNYAKALRAAKKFDEAVAASNNAIRLAPKLAFTYFGKTRALEDAGRFNEAIAVVEQTVALAPENASPWELKGKLLAEAKNYSAAYAAFHQALILQPTRAGVFVRRADAERAEGKRAAAIADLERYPADGNEADEVRDKLMALSLEEEAARNSAKAASEKTTTATPEKAAGLQSLGVPTDMPAPTTATAKTSCNFYSWTPLQRCIQEYHTDNDPLPTGPNPHRWNDQVAAEGRAMAGKYPEEQWDKTEWNAIVKKAAEDTASEKAELNYHAEQQQREASEETAQASLQSVNGEVDRHIDADKAGSSFIIDPNEKVEIRTTTGVTTFAVDGYYRLLNSKGSELQSCSNNDFTLTKMEGDRPLVIQPCLSLVVKLFITVTPKVPNARPDPSPRLAGTSAVPAYSPAGSTKKSHVGGGTESSPYLSVVYGMIMSSRHTIATTPTGNVNVTIAFNVDRSGRLVSAGFVRRSGYSEIDTEAMASIRRASPFPPPPAGAPHSLIATIDFGARQSVDLRSQISDNPVREAPSTVTPPRPLEVGQTRYNNFQSAAQAESSGSDEALNCGSATNRVILYRQLISEFVGPSLNKNPNYYMYATTEVTAFTTINKGDKYRYCQASVSTLDGFILKTVTYTVRVADDGKTQTISDFSLR